MARVRLQPEHAEVRFFEMARICRLPVGAPGYAHALQLLREAAASGTRVRVWLAGEHGMVIERVASAG